MSDYDIDDEEIYDEEEIVSSDDEFENDTILSDDGIEINKINGDIATLNSEDENNDELDDALYDVLDDELSVPDNLLSDTSSNKIIDNKILPSPKINKKEKLDENYFLDPGLINKNIVLERSNKPRILLIVANEDRITSDHLQKAERAGLIAIRAKQIANSGAPEYLNDIVAEMKKTKINISSNDIAEAELMNRKCPLKLRRKIGVNSKDELIVEEWVPNDMKIHI